jgi:hypothetical protein
MFRTALLWTVLFALALGTVSAGVQGTVPADRATFEIRVRDKPIGTETILIENSTDSLRVTSSSLQMLGPAGRDSLIKQTKLVATLEDLDLRAYASAMRFLGDVVERGVECEDTLVHLSTFAHGRGDQFILARPPGCS